MKRNRRRISLIEPPFYRLHRDTYSLDRFPLSLGYLSSTIKKDTDWQVMAYNADFNPNQNAKELFEFSYLTKTGFNNYLNNLKSLSGPIWKEIESTISEYKPAVVGISVKSQNFKSACIVAKLAKAIDNRTIVVVGGPHPSMIGPDVLKCPDIDIGVRGEGERTMVELLNVIDAHSSPHPNPLPKGERVRGLNSVKGIIYRKNGGIVENASREFIQDLDSLMFPHENASEVLKDYDKYPIAAFKNIFATRGCPYNCFFCGSRKIWSRKVRFRSTDNVIKEIKCLQKKGLQSIHFDDDTFGIHKQHINDLCNAIIKHYPDLKWSCELHVKLVDQETIFLMKRAGCHSIQIGIESGNNKILERIRKGITVEEALSACKIIKRHGIDLQVFFMIGFPWETEDAIRDSVAAMKRVECSSLSYSIFTPYPGTEAFEFCKENGLIDDNYDVSLYHHQSPLNHFCINITPQKFRTLASEIETMVDRKNSPNRIERIRRLFSVGTFRKIQALGIEQSFKKGIRLFRGK